MNNSALVSCEWLEKNFDADKQVILDASFFLPRQQRNAQHEYQQQHIPTAVGKMGISNDTLVLIYDNNHFFAAARVWWMFRVFGHDLVRVIDGGMARWKQLNFPVNANEPSPQIKQFKAKYCPELVFDLNKMRLAQQDRAWQIIDARSSDSFFGQRKLTDPSLQSGHIPGSINIPYAQLTESEQQTLKSYQALQSVFEAAEIDFSKAIVTTCGSGVSAAVLALALYQSGLKQVPVYDGSWAEWGRQQPV